MQCNERVGPPLLKCQSARVRRASLSTLSSTATLAPVDGWVLILRTARIHTSWAPKWVADSAPAVSRLLDRGPCTLAGRSSIARRLRESYHFPQLGKERTLQLGPSLARQSQPAITITIHVSARAKRHDSRPLRPTSGEILRRPTNMKRCATQPSNGSTRGRVHTG